MLHSWWRHQMETFSALLALCAGNSPVPVNSPHKGQWRGALMFSFIYAWINDWVNNREAGDLRRQDGHYDVIVMTGGSQGSRSSSRWQPLCWYRWITLKQEQSGRHFTNGISNGFSLIVHVDLNLAEVCPHGPIDNIPALVRVMA